ncbi:MAG TPA: alpha-ketoacid dehydrogenase subunit beta [Egicoccus sp.]|nr:alpha-ketoacid dehydrogenase subunit beta [Egicoccus sp.]HSK24923.1 alpha-ketoacid dehydrogenase subunit beta [Egicoccus sp.]
MSATDTTEVAVAQTMREALRQAIRDAILRDERVFVMGEDVGAYGGCFAVTMGLLAEFGPQRIRDTPLSELGITGAGIGAAMGGLRPIVELMTCNFSLLALDQLVNNAATLLHMSGGQLNVPLVVRTTAGAGRQLAAQHSHSFEPYFAHVPGLRVMSIATHEDARGVLWPALCDPDPVILFEYPRLMALEASLPSQPAVVDLDHAAIRRPGDDVTLVTYGAALVETMEAAETLAAEGIAAEVIDLRSLRPLDDATIMASVARTHRAVVVEEAWRTLGIGAEVAARITEQAFYDLDAPVERVACAEVPLPYASQMEQAALPQTATITAAVQRVMHRG